MLDNDNFVSFAMKHYESPSCVTIEDFNSDLSRFKYVRKIIHRYAEDESKIDIRLLLNHLITLFNIFERDACTAMLFFKIEKEFWGILAPMINYLNYLPELILPLNINTSLIQFNEDVSERLSKL